MSESTPDVATQPGDELLLELADDYLRRCRAGEQPTVDEYVAKHPELADRIRELFPAMIAMEQPGPGATVDLAPPTERVGAIIGRYKLLERIGEGGFGVVYMAEQQQPVRRKVALKVVKPGMDSRQVLARFEAERQALAIMDHPNIAKVFDAGATDSGRPYFVMELVKGEPITEFCDRNQFPPHERLELFSQVCHAVQHAHQKGIIHRDIKPTNVLVAMHDTTRVVKVIDFGVAKALGHELTDKTLFTGFAQLLGTPLYMSPEQAGQSSLDIDTRSDIYSLGVLLYELLTGTTPFGKERFRQAAEDEIRRIIREEEPPRPSARLSESKDTLPSVSAQRHMEPAKLTKLVRGELDWIVMRALEKDRARRYETAIGMARDIERYLQGEPVDACPPSSLYRFKKFVRRNKGPVLAAALVLLTLIGGIAGTSFGLVRAERARRAEVERAEGERQARRESQAREAETKAVLDFVANKIIKAARPEGQLGGLGHDVTLRRAIEAALPFVDESFADQPLVEARLRYTLGLSFQDLGEAEIAAAQFLKARALFTKQRGPDHRNTLQSMQALASCYDDLGRHAEALKLTEETLALSKASLGSDDATTLVIMNSLAVTYSNLGRHAEALKLNEEVLALRKAKLGSDHAETLSARNNVAAFLLKLGRYAEALKHFEEILPLQKASLGPDHPQTVNSMGNLANSYYYLGRHAEALKLYEETLAIRKAKLGPDHPNTLSSITNLAATYSNLGRYDEALKLAEETLAIRKAKLGPDHPDTLNSMDSLAICYFHLGRHAEALKLSEETLALKKVKLGSDHPSTLHSMGLLAFSYYDLGRHAEALKLREETLALQKAKLGPDHPHTLDSMQYLADSYADLGRDAEALKLREELVALRKAKLGPDRPDPLADDSSSTSVDRDLLRQSYEHLATTLFSQRRFDEAEQAMREVIALFADVPSDDMAVGVDMAWTHYNFGLGLYLADRVQDAAEQFREAFRRFEHVLAQAPEGDSDRTRAESALRWTLLTCPLPEFRDPDRALKLIQQSLSGEPSSGDLWNSLGIAHYRLGQWDEAIDAFQKSIELRNGGDSGDFYFLAMAHWQRGEQDEARQWYQRAVEHKHNQGGSNNPDLLNFRREAEELMGVTQPQPSTDTKPPEP